VSRLREGHQPTKTEVALFREMDAAKPLRRDTPPGVTGPRTRPLYHLEPGWTAARLLKEQTLLVDDPVEDDGPSHVDLAVEGLLAVLTEADPVQLRQRLLEHAAQVMLWAQELEQ
jgi:hypothetical protein